MEDLSKFLLEVVRGRILAHGVLGEGCGVDVGFSGGSDSVALVVILDILSREFGYRLRCHHVRHGLRESDGVDADFCRLFCEKRGIMYMESVLGLGDRVGRGESVEAVAREERYRVLIGAAKGSGVQYLASGHHGDDNVETLLWRLSRGCGLEGVGLSESRVVDGVVLFRPLLGVSSRDLREFLVLLGESWVEDESNAGDDYLRNRVRHSVMPVLGEVFGGLGGFYGSLLRIRRDSVALYEMSEIILEGGFFVGDGWFFGYEAFVAMGDFVGAQVFRHVAIRVCGGGYVPDSWLVEAFLSRVLRDGGERVCGGGRVVCSDGRIEVCRDGNFLYVGKVGDVCEVRLDWEGCKVDFGGVDLGYWGCVRSVLVRGGENYGVNDVGKIIFDAGVVVGCLRVESAGKVKSYCSGGRKRDLKKALSCMGVGPRLWVHYPVVVDDVGMLWCVGGPRDDRACLVRGAGESVIIFRS